MRRIRLCALSFLLFAGAWHDAAAGSGTVIRVGADAACDFRTDELPNALQSAIDSVPEHGAPQEIRLARSGSYVGKLHTIADRNLTLAGGYETCASASPDGIDTVIDADGSMTLPIGVFGSGNGPTPDVTLRDLRITGAGRDSMESMHGGGLLIGNAHVQLLSSRIDHNRAWRGGGIFVRATSGGTASLTLDQGSSVEYNTAVEDGGGILCLRDAGASAALFLRAASAVGYNVANDGSGGGGGGVASIECDTHVDSRPASPPGFNGGIAYNSATTGGGIAFGGNARLVVGGQVSEGDWSPWFVGNEATVMGGAILVNGADATASIPHAVFINNSANMGVALAALYGAQVEMERSVGRCRGFEQCLGFFNNNGNGVVAAFGEGTHASARGARFAGNTGTLASALLAAESEIKVENSVLTGNVGDSLVMATDGGHVRLLASTLAGNTVTTAVANVGASGRLSLGRSIVQDASAPVLARDPGNTLAQVRCSLLHEADSPHAGALDAMSAELAGRDPVFRDPAAGDFRLEYSTLSWAIDICPPSADYAAHDHLFEPRPVDSPLPDEEGPYDIGAYEWSPLLFRDGFEH